ncbi:NAD-dependent protein deacetylase sirtuin-4 [Trichinella pseudospiralis]|uniref:NAD-dependent protein deacetylase sirtuin-4 n=1 Tax=Trichinella pseudospiralis TaxID=6337 RepID=A0A0V1IX02_TRIPS|nr:NAD-dependent protein deacetylase sirtuin-4 [Trichinella pseudospiralis]KRZ27280.1 NAD-dependent protein deacetylase sirtuin-4 [Trichinella pseudospiralis]KRZ39958.1 NAD-dependent protein deacetylase sirtuin-4 [Trichinella pseudospiralis]
MLFSKLGHRIHGRLIEKFRFFGKSCSSFVPTYEPAGEEELAEFKKYLHSMRFLFVITGAGISTESGIPDYRSEGVGRYARSHLKPIQYVDFLNNARVRRRYWARNYVAWRQFSSVKPNRTHAILNDWEKNGWIHWMVTQNVDSLHCKAGSRRVTELHGNGFRVCCISCERRWSREELQSYIQKLNPEWEAQVKQLAPDGDVDLDGDLDKNFRMPVCDKCRGILKPDIVFFGENVPIRTVHFVEDRLSESDGLLAIGTSLQVLSVFRLVHIAYEIKKPILIVNIGPTRADDLATIKISSNCSQVLAAAYD